jgi:hypothetical protein
MLGKKIKISNELWEQISSASEIAMCTSPEEWAQQVLKDEAEKVIQDAGKGDVSDADVDEITRKLQGLGYLE